MTIPAITLRRRACSARGQSLLEFGLVLPFVLVLALGVIEVSYALLDQHVVTKLTREGSNLISRDSTLQEAATVLATMTTPPVNFASGSKMIFSVIKNVQTAGAANVNKNILYQRYVYGTTSNPGSTSALSTVVNVSGNLGSGPEYQAPNSDTDTGLQITNLPAGLVTAGGMLYVTEIYTDHPLITPFDKFGVQVPKMLYSIAYF
jgi:Flp pilus assembly protein TadG